MYSLTPEEKASLVMVYTPTSLIRGEVVTKQAVRVATWLRTDGVPEYLHLYNVQVLNFLGSQVRSNSYAEVHHPVANTIAFHLVPPLQDPLDYDESELNRSMEKVTVLAGVFQIKGNVRISTQTGFGTSIATSRLVWMTMYDTQISSPALPQMAPLAVPMLLIRPSKITFAIPAE